MLAWNRQMSAPVHHHHIVHSSTTHPPFILRLADGGLRLETSSAFRRTTIYLRRPSLLRCKRGSQRARERAREVEKRRGAEKNRFCRWQLSPELLLLCKQAIASGTPVCDLSQWSKSFPFEVLVFWFDGFLCTYRLRKSSHHQWEMNRGVHCRSFLIFRVGIWFNFYFFFLVQLPQNWGNSWETYPFGWVGRWSI